MRSWMPIAIAAMAFACMDPLTDYDECVRIETARCDLRNACKRTAPTHIEEEFGDFDYDTCIAYLKENCRVRQIETDDWKEQDIVRCVNAIAALNPTGCTTLSPRVDETENLPECWFIKTDETVEPDASVVDAGTDSGTDSDAGPDSG